MVEKAAPKVYPPTYRNKVKIVRGGADFFRHIEQISISAVHTLHLQTYIFDEDETGSKVASALIDAAKRGVHVYLLVDGYASQKLSSTFIDRMCDAGVHFAFFYPMLKSKFFYFGRRLHHKLIVADSLVCMVAGINISNRYNDMGNVKAWLDWAIHTEGATARGINEICERIWNQSAQRGRCITSPEPPASALPNEECMVQIRQNDWVFRKTEITKSYRELFRTAHTYVTVMTSYFWPPERLLKQMVAAARRGVKIKLILTATADVPFAKHAERYLYKRLLRNNIEIYEYERNILHGKVAVSDDKWLTAGSYNVNNISAFASVELNLDVRNELIANNVYQQFEQIIAKDCNHINKDNFWASSNYIKRFLYYCSYRLVHLMFFLFTFYFIQHRPRN